MKAKKILSILCTMAVVASMGMAAFATETEVVGQGSGEKELQVTLEATVAEVQPTYSVNISWTSMTFTYEQTTDKAWNIQTHTWSDAQGSWGDPGTVTVTNHSSAAVKVEGRYAPETEGQFVDDTPYKGVTVDYQNFTKETLSAGTPANIDGDENTNQTKATLTVTGVPTESLDSVQAGTITVTISPAAEEP